LTGSLVFGIGTRRETMLWSRRQRSGSTTLTIPGPSTPATAPRLLPSSTVVSNHDLLPDSTTTQHPTCSDPLYPSLSDFYCPSSTVEPVCQDSGYLALVTLTVKFSVANAMTLFSGDNIAFDNLGRAQCTPTVRQGASCPRIRLGPAFPLLARTCSPPSRSRRLRAELDLRRVLRRALFYSPSAHASAPPTTSFQGRGRPGHWAAKEWTKPGTIRSANDGDGDRPAVDCKLRWPSRGGPRAGAAPAPVLMIMNADQATARNTTAGIGFPAKRAPTMAKSLPSPSPDLAAGGRSSRRRRRSDQADSPRRPPGRVLTRGLRERRIRQKRTPQWQEA